MVSRKEALLLNENTLILQIQRRHARQNPGNIESRRQDVCNHLMLPSRMHFRNYALGDRHKVI